MHRSPRTNSSVAQELYDAIVPGNQAPWKKYFADDCIFSDEKGRTLDKAKLIADITPMPTGYSGTIRIGNVQSRILGETAILSAVKLATVIIGSQVRQHLDGLTRRI